MYIVSDKFSLPEEITHVDYPRILNICIGDPPSFIIAVFYNLEQLLKQCSKLPVRGLLKPVFFNFGIAGVKSLKL